VSPRVWRGAGAVRSALAAVACVLVFVFSAGCAGGRFVRPAGAAVPFAEATAIWAELSRPCRAVTMARAQLRVSGRVSGQRVPSLTTGLAVDADRLAIESQAGVRRVFTLAGDRRAVVLLNHLDGQATRGPAGDVVDALVGVRLEPDRLLALLSGCVSPDPVVATAERVGAVARLRTADSVIYLSERGGQWRLTAAEFGDVVADYRRVDAGWPRDIELRRGEAVTLRLRVIEFERNPQLPPAVFQLQVPDAFVEVPLDVLRQSGPLGRRDP
jgi:hypothetical protein